MPVKISSFPNANFPSDADLLTGLQGGLNKNFNLSLLSSFFGSKNLSNLADINTSLANIGLGGLPLIASASTSDIILTNPTPTFIIASFTTPGHILKLPPMNQSDSLNPAGIGSIFIFNDGSETYNIQYQDGTNIIGLNSQQAILLRLVDNSTANGTVIPQPWDLTINGITGQVTISGSNGINITNSGQVITVSNVGTYNAYIASSSSLNLDNPIEYTFTVDCSGFPNCSVILPDATTLTSELSQVFVCSNIGTDVFTLHANDGSTVVFQNLMPGYSLIFELIDASTTNGTWQVYDVQQITQFTDTGTGDYSILPSDYRRFLYQRVFILNNKTYTLPLISDTPNGFEFEVYNTTGNNVFIVTQGGDAIFGDTTIPPGCYGRIILRKSTLAGNAYLSTIVYNSGFINNNELSNFIVGTDPAKFTYTTIQDAMTAASLVASPTFTPVIIVTAGDYPDPWSSSPNIKLICLGDSAVSSDALPGNLTPISAPVNITGLVTIDFSGSNDTFSVQGGRFTNILIQNCVSYITFENSIIDSTAGQALQVNVTTNGNFISFIRSNFIGNDSIKQMDIVASSATRIQFIDCNSSEFINPVASTVGAGSSISIKGGNFIHSWDMQGNINIERATIGTSSSTNSIINLSSSSGSANVYLTKIFNLVNSNWISGVSGSNLTYNGVDDNGHNVDSNITQHQLSSLYIPNLTFNGVDRLSSAGQIASVATGDTSPSVMQSVAGNGIVLDFTSPNFTISTLPSSEQTSGSDTMQPNKSYIANDSSLHVYQLPVSCAQGDVIEISGKGTGLFQIILQSGQQIVSPTSSTTVSSGSVTSTTRYCNIRIKCITADLLFEVIDMVGSFNFA